MLVRSSMQTLQLDVLLAVTGGADQAQLRQLAQQYCPATFNQFKGAPSLTRPMAEKCLDEAHMGWAKGRLDEYFPKKK